MRARRIAISVVPLVGVALLGCSDGASEESGAGGADAGVGGTGALDAGVVEDPRDYLDRSLRDQVLVLEAGKITSVGLTQAYLDRIAQRDQGSTGIHAVLAQSPKALDDAASVDAEKGGGAK